MLYFSAVLYYYWRLYSLHFRGKYSSFLLHYIFLMASVTDYFSDPDFYMNFEHKIS